MKHLPNNAPWWVNVGLLCISTRNAALNWMYFSILCGFASILVTSVTQELFYLWFTAFFLSALWYWKCIKWVDTHHTWK